jgi:hypothetical protein
MEALCLSYHPFKSSHFLELKMALGKLYERL